MSSGGNGGDGNSGVSGGSNNSNGGDSNVVQQAMVSGEEENSGATVPTPAPGTSKPTTAWHAWLTYQENDKNGDNSDISGSNENDLDEGGVSSTSSSNIASENRGVDGENGDSSSASSTSAGANSGNDVYDNAWFTDYGWNSGRQDGENDALQGPEKVGYLNWWEEDVSAARHSHLSGAAAAMALVVFALAIPALF